jgi:DNA-binding GntR family transcriptional regulator
MGDNKVASDKTSIDKPGRAYSAIKELLFRRVLNPGQKLPYNDLCELIGLSKTPIINALNRLVYEGFILYEPNKGYRITPVDEKSISHLWEIRLELECINVRNAIQNYNRESFLELKKKHELLHNYKPQYTDRKYLELDMDMHIEIARMGGNKYSQTFLKTIMEHIHFMHRLERGVDRRKNEIEYEHGMVVESIGKRDVVMAEKYMRDHIEALYNLMLDYLQELKQTEGFFWG